MRNLIRPNIHQLQPYVAGKPIEEVQRELGLSEVVKLASNENPWGPSPKALEAVQRALNGVHLYPDASAFSLRGAIAQKFDFPESQVMISNGSDEIIHLLGQVLLDPGEDEILIADPTFPRYEAAAITAGCRCVKVPVDAAYKHDLAAMSQAITPRTKMVFLCNPNNPTGTIITRAELEGFLGDLPSGVVVVLDEAYYEFAAFEPSYPSALDYLREGYPVVVLRTFSKAYGLAGLRVGYGFAPDEIVQAIWRTREPFSVNSLAQIAALAALEDEDHLQHTVGWNRDGYNLLCSILLKNNIKFIKSYANFILANMEQDANPIFEQFLKKGVIVRPIQVGFKSHFLRISIGTEKEIEKFEHSFNLLNLE